MLRAGLVTLAVLLRRFYPQAGGADSTLLRTTLIVGPGAVILGLLILVFHLTRPWTFWKLMFHYSFTSALMHTNWQSGFWARKVYLLHWFLPPPALTHWQQFNTGYRAIAKYARWRRALVR